MVDIQCSLFFYCATEIKSKGIGRVLLKTSVGDDCVESKALTKGCAITALMPIFLIKPFQASGFWILKICDQLCNSWLNVCFLGRDEFLRVLRRGH